MDGGAIAGIVIGSICFCCILLYMGPFCFFKKHSSGCDPAETLVPQVKQGCENKVILITGATSGIGKETTRIICQSKCTIILACRNTNKASTMVSEFKALSTTHEEVNFIVEKLELSNLNQIGSEFVPNLSNKHNINAIDILLCNAGVYAYEKGAKTQDNFELNFGTNHLGHMRLVTLLKPKLDAAGDAGNGKSRVIVTSSSLHDSVKQHVLPSENYAQDAASWDRVYNAGNNEVLEGGDAYNFSKLCNMWFVREFAKRFGSENKITAVSLHPGVGPTGLMPPEIKGLYACAMDSIPQLAYTQTWLASTNVNLTNGEYYIGPRIRSVKPIGKNQNYMKSLWELSEKLINDVTNQA